MAKIGEELRFEGQEPVAPKRGRPLKVPAGGLAPNRATREKKAADRFGRLRVCVACEKSSDEILGSISSPDPCERCGKKPTYGFIVTPNQRMLPAPR
jgi:hypothetical protein